MPVALTRDSSGRLTGIPSILLASNTEQLDSSLHQALKKEGFEVACAGPYSGIQKLLSRQEFDVVLLEVTGEDAVEDAVATALRIKRANSDQFVGYLADSALDAMGLAGDGIFPRSANQLPHALLSFFASGADPES